MRDCADCPELVAIAPSGLAANNVVGFALSTADITFGAWDACVAAGPCPPADDNGRGRGTNPVTKVDRHDARLYTAWLTGRTGWRYRLPTAAEWEYAAKTGVAAIPAPNLKCDSFCFVLFSQDALSLFGRCDLLVGNRHNDITFPQTCTGSRPRSTLNPCARF